MLMWPIPHSTQDYVVYYRLQATTGPMFVKFTIVHFSLMNSMTIAGHCVNVVAGFSESQSVLGLQKCWWLPQN